MFATLIGPFPGDGGPGSGAGHLVALGLEPVGDGRGARVAGPDAGPGIVAAWQAVAASTPSSLQTSLLGPFSSARLHGGEPIAWGEAVGTVASELAEAGCPLVEVEEPEAVAAAAADDETLREALAAALRRAAELAAGRVHLSLVLTGGNVDGLGTSTLFDLPFASFAFDLIAGPDNWRLIAEAPGDRGIVCGALDPADAADDRPEPLVWAAHYAASTRGRGLERVGLANASSLASLSRDRATRKVTALVEAARIAMLEDPRDLAASLDPRSVDARSAAMGRYRPPR